VWSSGRLVEFADRDSDHQIIPNNPAAHSTFIEKGETSEHFTFGEVLSVAQLSANALRETFVVGHLFIQQ
jgi:hypothetical protein